MDISVLELVTQRENNIFYLTAPFLEIISSPNISEQSHFFCLTNLFPFSILESNLCKNAAYIISHDYFDIFQIPSHISNQNLNLCYLKTKGFSQGSCIQQLVRASNWNNVVMVQGLRKVLGSRELWEAGEGLHSLEEQRQLVWGCS